MKHIRNDQHFTVKGNKGSLSVDQERVVLQVGVGRAEWESGREGGLGPEGMGKIRGICRQHMPALPLCENPSAARGRESAFIGHLRPAPSRGMGASSGWSTLLCGRRGLATNSAALQLCLRWRRPGHCFQ